MNSKLLGILGTALIAAPVAANAQETLDYSAGIFSGDVILASPLPENGSNISVSPAEFNFSQIAGLGASYNYFCPGCGYALGGMSEYGGASFTFSTVNGRISAWDINIDFTGTPGTNTETTLYATISNTGDSFIEQSSGYYCAPAPGQANPCPPNTGSSSNVGGWTAVPEVDSSSAISGIMLLIGGATALRGRRRTPNTNADCA
jgi:hypothetical protein